MKTPHLLFLFFGLFTNNLNAQWINSITVSPANPKTTDTIYVTADCSFPYGGCGDYTQFAFVNGNTINAAATHCLGLLTYICGYTDTIIINPLPAGNYNFFFNVNYGVFPAPCSPGIVPGPTDSITFTVIDANAIFENEGYQFHFTMFPNPVSGQLHLTVKDASLVNKNTLLKIYALTGQELFSTEINNKEMSIDLSKLSDGIYMFHFSGSGLSEKHLIEVKN